jgi:hypothetical protein
MPRLQRVGDLELAQDLAFQRLQWRIQRVAWVAIALLILASLLGLFGRGPLSRASAGGPQSPLTIDYDRFVRVGDETELVLHLGPGAVVGKRARVGLASDYLDRLHVERITPQPEAIEAGGSRHVFVFLLADGEEGASVTLHLKPSHAGPLPGRAGCADGTEVTFSQFSYP